MDSGNMVTRRQAVVGLGGLASGLALGAALAGPGAARADSAGTSGTHSRSGETLVELADDGVKVDGEDAAQDAKSGAAVYVAHDVVYYEDRDTYDSGNAYGEGTAAERHSAEDAEVVAVVHISQPGTYRLTGSLSAGQVAVDLGEDADSDPEAVVTLVLDGVDIACDVAPAIIFYNVYECDGDWSEETASSDVDTSAAGANIVLADGSSNRAAGSHVARIYRDDSEQKKLWKIDGAVYSFMSMNVGGEVAGTGSLEIEADNEGLDSELHLTLNGGNVSIRSQDDGINTNEDGVSVCTINGGTLHIIGGLGDEGDGIDSNGWLVINGGTVIAMANPRSDSGLDSDMGSYINGGTVVALGSTMDWPESESAQVTMNLQFASEQDAGDAIVVEDEEGGVVFAYDPSEDETAAGYTRSYLGAVVSCPAFDVGQTYQVFIGGVVDGEETQGVYDASTVAEYVGGVKQAYTGTDVRGFGGPGGFGGFGGPGQGGFPGQGGPGQGGFPGQGGAGESAGSEPPAMPGEAGGGQGAGGPGQGEPPSMPEGAPGGQGAGGPEEASGGQPPAMPGEADGGQAASSDTGGQAAGGGVSDALGSSGDGADGDGASEASTEFYMQDMVNSFSGVTAA